MLVYTDIGIGGVNMLFCLFLFHLAESLKGNIYLGLIEAYGDSD